MGVVRAGGAGFPVLVSGLLGVGVGLMPGLASGQVTCGYATEHGTAELVGFQETWQDPDCPECDPLPLLRIDEDGFGSDHLFFTPGQSGACIDTEEYNDPATGYGFDLLVQCKDTTQNYVWRAFNPDAIGLTLSPGLEISEEYETREDTSGNPGLLVPFDELRSIDGLPLFPSTGTYEIRRQLVGCGDESGAEALGQRCSVSPEIACSEDVDCPGTETCEEGHWGQWIRVEVTKKFQNGLVRFSDSAVDNDAALTLFEYSQDLFDICSVEDHVNVAVEARGLCSALDPAPSIVSYDAGFVPEECGISSFQWQVQPESSVVWDDIAAETGEGLDQGVVQSLLPAAGWTGFRRDATSTTGVDGATNEMTVAVLGDFFPEVSPVAQNVCQEATDTVADLVVSHAADTAQQLLYQWQSRPAGGGPNDWADIAGATSAALGPGPETLEYRAKVWPGIAGLPESWNLALDGTATQSSDFSSAGQARFAIDGNTDGFWSNGSVSHTDSSPGPAWWEVELPHGSKIEAIHVWNRTDCCSDRLTNFRVSILDGFGTPVYSADAFTEGGFPLQRVDFIPPSGTPPGKKVRVELLEPLGPEPFLQLAEVEVLGYQVCGPFFTPPARVLVGPEAAEYFPDADGDGYPNKTVAPVTLCEAQAGFAPGILQGDCDDADPEEYPGQRWFTDADQDGLAPRDAAFLQQCPRPGAFSTSREPGDPFDCDDTDPDVSGVVLWAQDGDRDAYSTGVTQLSCARPLGFAPGGGHSRTRLQRRRSGRVPRSHLVPRHRRGRPRSEQPGRRLLPEAR